MIKNIIFDFGGVLLDIDFQRTYDALSVWTKNEMVYPELPENIKKWVWEFETGKMNTETFIWNVQHLCPDPKPQGFDIVQAWNAMLIGWDPRKFVFLDELRKKYKVYLLSNTNTLHIDWVIRDLKTKHGIHDFETRFFDKTFYSFEMGKHKPDPDIYTQVLTDAGIKGEESIFIDDSMVNIQAAAALGIHVYHHNPKKDLIEVFAKRGW